MDKKIKKLFECEKGKELYSITERCIRENNMHKKIEEGVLIGLSGGADSVMLLCFLYEYRRRNKHFPILAVHINHMIRGLEADRDESFASDLCRGLNIEFISRKIDIPSLAKADGVSIEECARNERYREFSDIIHSRNDISTIAVAHNADDNLETVILNIFRGAGTKGAAGIPPVRENIIRPLIYLKKTDIICALSESLIAYVTDSTNSEIEYKRNRVRHNIVPELYGICDDPVSMAARLSKNLRVDDEFINILADAFLSNGCAVSGSRLALEHKAVKVRVLSKMAKAADVDISGVIIDTICDLLTKGNFSYSLPGGAKFVCEHDVCRIVRDTVFEYDYNIHLKSGKNILDEYDSDFYLTEEKIEDFSLNVYKISIQADLSSAIIDGNLYLRPKADGDTVFYGGITRKLKKLFSDLKIPKSLRGSIPILCDNKGVLWIPGFGVRDDGGKANSEKLYATLAIGKNDNLYEKRFRSASEYR